LKPGGRIVVLDPEVAEVFQSSQEVNALLRAVLQAMPMSGCRRVDFANERLARLISIVRC
jgi:hypothetical protein